MTYIEREMTGSCGVCGESMDRSYRGKWICPEHPHPHECSRCAYETECWERIAAALNVVCELQVPEDLVRAELRAEGVL